MFHELLVALSGTVDGAIFKVNLHGELEVSRTTLGTVAKLWLILTVFYHSLNSIT